MARGEGHCERGHTRVIVKPGNEPASKSISGWMCDMRSHPGMTEESLEYEPQVNSLAERSMQTIQILFNTLRRALENRIGGRIPDDQPVLMWIVCHTAALHRRYHVGVDGRTLWERVAGKRWFRLVAESGERVMCLTRPLGRRTSGQQLSGSGL